MSIQYRSAKVRDIDSISRLLVESFEEDGEDTESVLAGLQARVSRKIAEQQYKSQLQRRWKDLVENPNVQHSWIVAINSKDELAGFMELGTMPALRVKMQSNLSRQEEITENIENNKANETLSETPDSKATPKSKSTAFQWTDIASGIGSPRMNNEPERANLDDGPDDESTTKPTRKTSSNNETPERPFLANLAVRKNYRRQQIGYTLVQLALKISQKWYPREDEEQQNTAPSKLDPSSPVTRANEQGEVPVAMYLAVDTDNLPAIRLYEDRLKCTRVLDEMVSLSPQAIRKLKRPPRLYFEKKLYS